MVHGTEWLPIAQGILTAVIAIITTYIAWQQWKGNQLKSKMDRHDRRLRIYQEVVKMLRTCVNEPIEFGDIIGFGAATAEADFLFGPEIRQYLDEITVHAVNIRGAKADYRNFNQPVPSDYNHEKIVKVISAETEWFSNQLVKSYAKNKFAPYLDISRKG